MFKKLNIGNIGNISDISNIDKMDNISNMDNVKIAMGDSNGQIESVEPEIIEAVEHVPCCRKCCDECIMNEDECIMNESKCRDDWIKCGENADEHCIRCCKLNFGELLQSRCPRPCFKSCNENACCNALFSLLAIFGVGLILIIVFCT